jgi:hypothetical protein
VVCFQRAGLDASPACERALSNDHDIPGRQVEMERQNQAALPSEVPVSPGSIEAEGFSATHGGDARNPAPTELDGSLLCKQEALQFPTRASQLVYECKLRLRPQSCFDYCTILRSGKKHYRN